MIKQTFLSIVLIGAGAFGFAAAPASALTLPAAPQVAGEQAGTSKLMTEVSHRRGHNTVRRAVPVRRVYSSRLHGPRCTYRRGNCRHYYGGYYYNSPWWLAAPLIGGAIVLSAPGVVYAGGSRHVAWCRAKYRSYNARTNTWIAYGGEVRRCNSPYR